MLFNGEGEHFNVRRPRSRVPMQGSSVETNEATRWDNFWNQFPHMPGQILELVYV